MFKKSSAEKSSVVVIRDADVIAAALGRALEEASDELRPGLEHAVALARSAAAATEAQVRGRWARSRWADAGFSGDLTSAEAVKALREAEPGLSLLEAVRLRDDAVAHPE
ncbi:hypothetical protein [Streptomyces sp. NPDC002588]|uniref:hypothetical protein n=1 Tax=Streptomyces sp. NPDC002588 TaxID=3154419 RepID=UPI00331B2F41